MKLVYPKEMTPGQAKKLNICLASASPQIPRSQIISSLAAGLSSIVAGARIIIEHFAIPKLGDIDIIVADKSGRSVFVNICQVLDGAELCKILERADWMIENGELIQNFHPGIRAGRDLRQIIFAGRIEPGARSALCRMTENPPDVFEYNCAELDGETWIIVQKFNIARDKQYENLIKSRLPELGPRHFDMKSVLTQEEIGDFFDRSSDDDVTSKCGLSQI